jgi:NAD(P)H-dependent FMN reductase
LRDPCGKPGRLRFQREFGRARRATGLRRFLAHGSYRREKGQKGAGNAAFQASEDRPEERKAGTMTTYKAGYIVGSLATASLNRTLAKALVRLAPPDLEFAEIPIKDLPVYSYDYDAHYPAAGRALKHALASVDAVLFVTPEYNRSIPGGLKNAIDWASRPPGQNSFAGKPSAVIGASPGRLGTALAQVSLRAVLGYLNSPQMNTPEAYVQLSPGQITDEGDVTDVRMAQFLQKFVADFQAFIDMVLTPATSRR